MQEHVTEEGAAHLLELKAKREEGARPRALQFQRVSKLTEELLPLSSLGASKSLVLHMLAVFALFSAL